jgi:hypothetical protein
MFLDATYQNGENIPNDHKMYPTALCKNITVGHKID